MKKYPLILLGLYILAWIWGAINPTYRSIWLAENILPVLVIIALVTTYKYMRFSNTSYTLLFIFLVLHVIGGHYGYVNMPLFDTFKETFGWERNNYDRVVHFLFGALFLLPLYEIISKVTKSQGNFTYFVTLVFLVGLKGIFEIIEYWYGVNFQGGLLDTHYVGMQGDIWDAQKDMFMGLIGGTIAWIVLLLKDVFKKRKNVTVA